MAGHALHFADYLFERIAQNEDSSPCTIPSGKRKVPQVQSCHECNRPILRRGVPWQVIQDDGMA